MAIEKKNREITRIKYDTIGPDGNAFMMIGFAYKNAKVMGFDEDAVEDIVKQMKSKDYNHLLQVFNHYFGDFVDLILMDEVYNSWDDFYFKKFDLYGKNLNNQNQIKFKVEKNEVKQDRENINSDSISSVMIGKRSKKRIIITPNELDDLIKNESENQTKNKKNKIK